MRTLRVILAILSLAIVAAAQLKTYQREFDRPVDDIKQALQALKSDDTARLPTLRGFVTDNLAIGNYERPYYQFETEVVSRNAERTLLKVKARITAWYSDPAHNSEEYRSMTSSGRLEQEFLDRVTDYLVKSDTDLTGRISTLEKMLADLNGKTEALQKQRDDLTAENKRLESVVQTQANNVRLVMTVKPGVAVVDRPVPSAHTLVTAQRDDVFEVAGDKAGWVEVKLGSDQNGWIPAGLTRNDSDSDQQSQAREALNQKPKPFVVTREAVTPFLGDWPSLRGKKALFLWAQPVGLSQKQPREKLSFVKQMFADRYRDAAHSEVDYSGLVIIFIGSDNKSGVAAARLDDIGQWVEGRMPESEFLNRCSLDPPEVFRAAHK
jgi:hypothetical protein